MTLSEIQIIMINQKLKQNRLEHYPLYEEMLDHICCLVETNMDNGYSYEQAVQSAFEKLGPQDVSRYQKETNRLLNRNQIIMKRITIAASVLAGICFMISTLMFAQSIPTMMPLSEYEITSAFGKRVDPFSKETKQHWGIDLKAPTGTPVLATADGTVIRVENQPDGYGKFVVIEHANNYQTRYAQLSEHKVSVGSKVAKGNVIGLVGSSGRSTAPHLHYEVMLNGKRIDPASTIEDS
jgi:murein DD-endopeptidase MepM/ murein hydrolase activator NlpD